MFGGEGGIRTRGGDKPTHAFQACDLNRSSTSPKPAIIAQFFGLKPNCAQSGEKMFQFFALEPLSKAMAVPIRPETSLILPGTIMVLFFWASWA